VDLCGRSVLVTGGSRGIGLATAHHFLALGANVTITGRDEERLTKAAALLDAPGRVCTAVADVSTPGDCRRSVTGALEAYGRLDVLFANAGSYEPATIEEMSEELWDRTIDTHLKGAVFCVQAALPALREQRGSVVLMASDAGLRGLRGGWSAYCAAMGGVVNLTRQLALELAPLVRVNAVAPGPVETGTLLNSVIGGSYAGLNGDDPLAEMIAGMAIGRLVTADEVAAAVCFLALATATTGSVLSVDGGTSAALP
jgi:NAD(P)-dependent dehydrogenase (short-subunit alcohol dehydrogenase family)